MYGILHEGLIFYGKSEEIYQSDESYGYLSATESETKETIPKIFAWLQAALEVVWWGIWCSIEPACTTLPFWVNYTNIQIISVQEQGTKTTQLYKSWCLQTITYEFVRNLCSHLFACNKRFEHSHSCCVSRTEDHHQKIRQHCLATFRIYCTGCFKDSPLRGKVSILTFDVSIDVKHWNSTT